MNVKPVESKRLSPAASDRPDGQACLQINGELLEILISPGHDYWGREGAGRLQHGIQSVASATLLAGQGIEGDRYALKRPGHKAQVTFLDVAVVEAVRARFALSRLPAGVFRRNLIVRGVDLAQLKGQRFRLQGVEFYGTQECRPCEWMDRVIASGAQDFLRAPFFGGLRASVTVGGGLDVDA